MRAAPPGNKIICLSIPALLFQERCHGLSEPFLHIDDGAVLVERQYFDFAFQNVMYFAHVSLCSRKGGATADVRFGSEADMCSARAHVRFAPLATAKADFRSEAPVLHLGWL